MPLIDVHMLPDELDVLDQRLSGVLADVSCWFGVTGATLVEQNQPEDVKIEEYRICVGDLSARPTVQEYY